MTADTRNVAADADPHFWEKLIGGLAGGIIAIGAAVRKLSKRADQAEPNWVRELIGAVCEMRDAQRETTKAINALSMRLETIHHETTTHVTTAFAAVGVKFDSVDKALAILMERTK
jgi:hypothetical protein